MKSIGTGKATDEMWTAINQYKLSKSKLNLAFLIQVPTTTYPARQFNQYNRYSCHVKITHKHIGDI